MEVYQYAYSNNAIISTKVMPISTKKRIKSTIIVDAEVWKEVRIEAIRRDMEIGQFVEESLREKLAADKATELRIRKRVKEISKGLDSLEKKLLGGDEEDQEFDKEPIITKRPGQPESRSQQEQPQQAIDANINVSNSVIHKQRGQNQLQWIQSDYIHVFDKDIEEPKIGRGACKLEIDVPGLKFPINKVELIEFVEQFRNIRNSEALYTIFNELPVKTYANVASLESSLIELLNNTKMKSYMAKEEIRFNKSDFVDKNVVDCKINVEKKVKNGRIEIEMPGIKFPITKNEIIQYANQHKWDPSVRDYIIEKLPETNKSYTNISELQEDIVKIFNTDIGLINEAKELNIDKVVGCVITTTDENKSNHEKEILDSQSSSK